MLIRTKYIHGKCYYCNEKGPTQNEEWRIVRPKNKETGTMQWRQRLNISSGTARDESGSNAFSADI